MLMSPGDDDLDLSRPTIYDLEDDDEAAPARPDGPAFWATAGSGDGVLGSAQALRIAARLGKRFV